MSRLLLALLLLVLGGCSSEERAVSQPRKVVLVPIGPVPAEVLSHLQKELPALVDREVVIGDAIAPPAKAFDVKRGQYLGTAILEELARHDVEDADRVFGIIDADAYAPGLNFIFGQARLPGRVAFIALPRLRDSFRGRPDNVPRFHERALKESVHELGHSFGFQHCPDPQCVMHFSNSFLDTDRKGARYCVRHEVP